MEEKRDGNDKQQKRKGKNNEEKIINCKFDKNSCEFIETKTEKQIKEEDFRKEIEQIMEEHKDEFDKLS